MRRAATVAFVLVLALASTGLARKSKKEMSGGFGAFGPYLAYVDYDGINSVLGQHEFDDLESLHWMFGGGGYAHVGRIVIGGCGWGGTQNASSEEQLVRVDIGGGLFEAGYSLINMKHFIVTPMLGIGGSGYTITVENRDVPENFEEFLEGPGPTSQVAFSGFTLAPELVINLPVKFVGLQLKGGYMYTPSSPDWKFPNGGSMIRGPEVAKGHPFASLSVTFGGVEQGRKKSKKKGKD